MEKIILILVSDSYNYSDDLRLKWFDDINPKNCYVCDPNKLDTDVMWPEEYVRFIRMVNYETDGLKAYENYKYTIGIGSELVDYLLSMGERFIIVSDKNIEDARMPVIVKNTLSELLEYLADDNNYEDIYSMIGDYNRTNQNKMDIILDRICRVSEEMSKK